MDLKEKAKLFAIDAHRGQIRKNEPDKPMIIHPISVGMLLEEYGYDDVIVAAGYLHDVVEDTKVTIEDIKREFGSKVASLVIGASEKDKTLSWEVRKRCAIDDIKKMSLDNKVVICADKINNLEDLMIKFQKNGERDFSAFNRGEEQQRWYYTNVYESLISGEDDKLPIFMRLKKVLDIVFYGVDDLYLRDVIFDDNREYYAKLKKLDAKKLELKRLKALCFLTKPFVIEFSGTPRTGKTTTINNLYDFFKKGGFSVDIIEEFTTSKYYKEDFIEKYQNVGRWELNVAIMEEVVRQLERAVVSGCEIILIDRSINDRRIWNYRSYARGDVTKDMYQQLRDEYKIRTKELIDFLVVTYADPLISLKRDYCSSLALEKRRFLNIDNLNEFNSSLMKMQGLFDDSVLDFVLLDTSEMAISDVSVNVASRVMDSMRKRYIKSLNKKYK